MSRKTYSILHTVETVSLDGGVEAFAQPSKPRHIAIKDIMRRKGVRIGLVAGSVFLVLLCIMALIAVLVVVSTNKRAGGGVSPSELPPGSCLGDDLLRLGCSGRDGQVIGEENDCVKNGCCWNSSRVTPCYSAHPVTCPPNPLDRLQCLIKGVDVGEKSCTASGCCWDGSPNTGFASKCFKPLLAMCPRSESMRFNCIPEMSSTASNHDLCNQRQCCWNSSSTIKCAFTLNDTYSILSAQETAAGHSINLQRNTDQPSLYGNDITHLVVDIKYETSTRVHVLVGNTSPQTFS